MDVKFMNQPQLIELKDAKQPFIQLIQYFM